MRALESTDTHCCERGRALRSVHSKRVKGERFLSSLTPVQKTAVEGAPLTVSSRSVRASPHRVLCKQGHASLESRKIHFVQFSLLKQQNLVSGNWCKIALFRIQTYTSLNPWLVNQLLRILAVKVRTFWEAHKIWKNLPHGLRVY